MQTSDKGISLIKEFEGCKLAAYQDSIGVWTIGYGWISLSMESQFVPG
jgi:GH24 family phage-related lysozyme (muramidase)